MFRNLGKKLKEALIAVLLFACSTAVCLGIAEVVLRFLPVATGMHFMDVTAQDPIAHFLPNHDFTWSRGWNMEGVNHGHINNAGFVNDQDYHRDDRSPLLAVVGDSYIEAAMVPFSQTVHGRLAQRLKGRLRVYSFGTSGAPLSQYLMSASYAVRKYGAKAVVINVVGNDFDESVQGYGADCCFWKYVRDSSGTFQLRMFEYRNGGMHRLMGSALMQYLINNLKLGPQLHALRLMIVGSAAASPPKYAGNTSTATDAKRVQDSLAAIDAVLRDVPGVVGLPANRVTFLLDGLRYPEAAAAAAGTYFDVMRKAFKSRAEAKGYEVIDLDPRFFLRHGRTGERFEYPDDGHWNPAGHEVAYEAVMGSRLMNALMPSD